MRARFYNPVIGRFTQEDVYRGDGLNLYAYVGNNPVNYSDPSGYKCHKGDPYEGVKQASQYLKDLGLPRGLRKEILESFDVPTITMDVAGDSSYGIRFYGGSAKPSGPYLFETFTPEINRANLALPPEWNSMTGIKQWQIKSGTTIIKGNAAPQFGFGSQYVGGARQIWVPNPWDNLIDY